MVTEVVDARDVAVVAEHADMLQVGTRNMANFGLLQAVGESGRPVLLKRGMNATVEEWLMAAEYIAQRGNLDVVLCERGIRTFEPATRNTLDISAVPVVQATSHLPIIVDPSHAAGRKDLVVPLSRAAIAVGADGVIVDVHPDPETALCDGPQALNGADLRALAQAVRQLPPVVGRVDASTLSRTPAVRGFAAGRQAQTRGRARAGHQVAEEVLLGGLLAVGLALGCRRAGSTSIASPSRCSRATAIASPSASPTFATTAPARSRLPAHRSACQQAA